MSIMKNKVAVVTGVASETAHSMAECCAKAGMNVILADAERTALQRVEQELRVAGAIVSAIQVDMRKAWGVQTLALVALDTFGSVDLLFDYAGMSEGRERWESQRNNWAAALDENLWSRDSASARLAGAFATGDQQDCGAFLSIAGLVLQSMAQARRTT